MTEEKLWMQKTGARRKNEPQKKGKRRSNTGFISRIPLPAVLLILAVVSFGAGLAHGLVTKGTETKAGQMIGDVIVSEQTTDGTAKQTVNAATGQIAKDSADLTAESTTDQTATDLVDAETPDAGTTKKTSFWDRLSGKTDTDETDGESEETEEVPALPEDPEETEPDFSPHSTSTTAPSHLIEYTNIRINDDDLASTSAYQPDAQIDFGTGVHYTDVEGIISFRGNNFRNKPSYGFAEMTEHAFGEAWTKSTGSLGSWTGSGWTGQPLMMKWPADVKAHMNMYDWAKTKEDLVEVIYATMDGNIYFLDLETGQATRDSLYLGYTFKGAGALDPRGYPIMYLGAGINSETYGTSKAFIINLLDCTVMYTFGSADPFSLRGALSFFDSSALVDAETDTLIYPGENGILYLMKLNTDYDLQAGTLTINPTKVVKWRYNGTRSNSETYWWGMEDSACIYRGYLFVADNGGNLMCLDLNKLELVWVQDVLDDTNDSPVLSVEDGHVYLYISTSFHLGWRSYDTAEIPIWKIDAETGEIVWKKSYNCHSIDGVSGGVQSTIALGANDLSDYIYVTVSMTESISRGVLTCINKQTGEVAWEHAAYYAWSSPACVYNSDGSGVVIYCTSEGEVFMLDGLTGAVLSQMTMNGNVEASPAVYNDRLVVGTRNCTIYGVQLK